MPKPTGTIYDGNGNRLKGDTTNPDNILPLSETLVHKTILFDGQSSKTVKIEERDRFFLVPDHVKHPQDLPLPWMFELAELLVSQGRIGVLATNADSLRVAVSLLSHPDQVIADARREAHAVSAQASGNGTQSVGILCNGTGAYLDGDRGQAIGWQTDEARQFRGFISGNEEARGRAGLLPRDRLYIMPADYTISRTLPVWIIAELMKTIKRGNKILVIAPSQASFDRLLQLISEPEKLLLLVEPAVGNA